MKLFLLLMVICGVYASTAERLITLDEIESLFKKFTKNELSDAENELLHEVFEILQRPEPASSLSLEYSSPNRMTIDCIVCRSAFGALFDSVRAGQSDDELIGTITSLCIWLGIENHNVCSGAVALNLPIINYIVRNTPKATPAAFCGLIMQSADNPDICPFNDPRFEWTVDLPEKCSSQVAPQSEIKPLTIALITDAHIDPLYEAFGVANCDEPTCCRKGQRPASSFIHKSNIDESVIAESIVELKGETMLNLSAVPKIRNMKKLSQTSFTTRDNAPAGFWGDYRNCDTPIWAYDEAIDTITESHKDVDIVYYIGDTVDHGVWETTYELIDDVNFHMVDKLRQNFGDDVKVVAAIGNHESQPTNQFAPSSVKGPKLNTTWLYDALVRKWGYYLTDEAKATLHERGDFAVLVRPGLKVISINNNVAYKYNWWLVYDPIDAKKHLDWLVEELYKSELAGEKVHILAHIPPGVHDLTHTWTREYNRIVNRFTSTIAAEFNGHTHSDEFKIFYSLTDNTPINVAWGAGSVTAYTNYNLNYKIVTIDPDTYETQRIENYVYNLTEANLTPNRRPHWFKLYDFKNSFGLTDLSAASLDTLVNSMVTYKKYLLDLYVAFYSKLSDTRWPYCVSNSNCKLDQLCKTVVTVLWERERCEKLRQTYLA